MSHFLKLIGALYSTDYNRRLKTCQQCNVQFSDVTKRNLGHMCSMLCQRSAMVATRHKNGSYVQTQEQKEKMSVSVKATYASREVFSPEVRKKFSETMKKTWREGKIDTSNHWTKTIEGKLRLSLKYKGIKLGPQPKMSISAQRRLRTKRETLYTSANGGIRSDLGLYFRSNWEANFARILNLQGKVWVYEEKTFQLEPSLSYTPDFYIPDEDAFYELKGRMDEKSQRQLQIMHEKLPHVTLHVIDGVKYAELRVQYKHLLLSTWEGK